MIFDKFTLIKLINLNRIVRLDKTNEISLPIIDANYSKLPPHNFYLYGIIIHDIQPNKVAEKYARIYTISIKYCTQPSVHTQAFIFNLGKIHHYVWKISIYKTIYYPA